jgi:hypothetical protein
MEAKAQAEQIGQEYRSTLSALVDCEDFTRILFTLLQDQNDNWEDRPNKLTEQVAAYSSSTA